MYLRLKPFSKQLDQWLFMGLKLQIILSLPPLLKLGLKPWSGEGRTPSPKKKKFKPEAVSLVPSHIAIWLIYYESIWFQSHKEKSHMKSYNVMTWSIFGRTGAEDRIESAVDFLINTWILYGMVEQAHDQTSCLEISRHLSLNWHLHICKIKYKNIFISTLFIFNKYMTWEVI